jgi:hypothetical protein
MDPEGVAVELGAIIRRRQMGWYWILDRHLKQAGERL